MNARFVINRAVVVFAVLSLFFMAIIFSFSAKSAPESTVQSHYIGFLIGSIVHRDFNTWPAEKKESYAEKMDFAVRKTAHTMEYALLGFLIMGTIGFGFIHSEMHLALFLITWLFTSLYGISDEIHQYFVPGRACQLRDMIIDSCGALVGIAMMWCMLKIAVRKTKNHALR